MPGESPRTHLFPDHPVRDGKVAFEFAGIARTMAELALNPANRTPFTVVVKGEWGRGKTTLLRETQRLLDGEGTPASAKRGGHRQVRTLWFNAWKYPAEDTILAGLLGALLDRLRSGDLREQAKLLVDEHKGWAARTILRMALPSVFGNEEPESRYTPVEVRRAFYDGFSELFGQLSYAWFHGWKAGRDNFGQRLGNEASVAVFLDDLDRCRRERVQEVLEAINLFLDQPGVCFYLGLDWVQLRRLLGRGAPGTAEGLIEDPELFLEKIVQVAVELPGIEKAGAQEYIGHVITGSSLQSLLQDEVIAVSEALTSRNPRHAKRFLNDLSIRLGVLRHTGKLGDGEDRVSAEAILSWHILVEFLDREEAWRRHTLDRANLDAFLRRYEALKKAMGTGTDKTGPEGEPEPATPTGERAGEAAAMKAGTPEDVASRAIQELIRIKPLRRHVDRILALSRGQRDLLVSLGSPPREEAQAGPAGGHEIRPEPGPGGWVLIPGGTFRMGSEEAAGDERPVHTVTLSAYRISRTPVTNAEYAAYIEATGASTPRNWVGGKVPRGGEDHPVVSVSWSEASAYCDWLGEEIGDQVDLPTEAQWEFAARGEEGRTYPWGEEEPTEDRANFGDNVGGTSPVGGYPGGATPEGVHDLAGNVWEWCRDWYGPYGPDAVTDPEGPGEGESRVLRGGAFLNEPRHLRAAFRSEHSPRSWARGIGFRCVAAA